MKCTWTNNLFVSFICTALVCSAMWPTSGNVMHLLKENKNFGKTGGIMFVVCDSARQREIKLSQSIWTPSWISPRWLMKRAALLFPHTRVPLLLLVAKTLLYQLVFAWLDRAWALLFFHRLLLFVLPSSLTLFLSHSSLILFPDPPSPFLALYHTLISSVFVLVFFVLFFKKMVGAEAE